MLIVNDFSLSYLYRDDYIRALNRVSFSVKPGESLGIIGETGSGKSTLAQSLLDLITVPHKKQGEIMINQQNLNYLRAHEIKQLRWNTAAIVFQNSLEVLNPVMTVGTQIIEPLTKKQKLSASVKQKELNKLFELVGLDPKWKDAYPHQLSGGMRQRVLLAMALSCEPELLILDEPTSSLDEASSKRLQKLLLDLQNQLGFSMVAISHDINAISMLTEQLMILYQGEVVEKGTTEEILEEPEHPYSRGLINASVQLFPHKDLWGIPGEQEIAIKTSAKEKCAFASRCTQTTIKCENSRPPVVQKKNNREVLCHQGGITDILRADQITKSFQLGKGEITAVAEVDMYIKHGETVALIGPSGSGKSTLAQILCGFTPSDKGNVEFLGYEIKNNWAISKKQGMQLVLQDPYSSVSHRLTVLEAVTEPLKINKLGDCDHIRQNCKSVLKAVQLPSDNEFLNRWCSTLSGGQRQRLAIARALIMDPKLLIADEITSMLDVSTQANILRILKGLQNRQGFSLLYVTHDLALARKVADRVYVLNNGQVIEQGSSAKIDLINQKVE